MFNPTLFSTRQREPLASRVRPERLEEFLGQEHLLGEGRPLRDAILADEVGSMVFWGPPGCGKTTLARLIAKHTKRQFESFSAVTDGVARVRQIVAAAEKRLELEGRGTILFCDEIHRFNKAQQDAFLPWVERGVVTLVGATTENPSFELTGALLSRLRVFVLEPLAPEQVVLLLERAVVRATEEASRDGVTLSAEALDLLVRYGGGDGRKSINALEAVLDSLATGSKSAGSGIEISADDVARVLERRMPRYDKGGEEHFNSISALHKSVRGSDVEGSLYWLARMIAAGEDGMYLARRIVRMATEDVGLADPRALTIALAAKDSYHLLGAPEGELALAQAVIYLAAAPKSNRVYEAWARARDAAEEHSSEPVPLHLRNAPTGLLKRIGYGAGYRYDHAEKGGLAAGQEYLPEVLRGVVWYEPTDRGFENTMRERMKWWGSLKRSAMPPSGQEEPGS